MMGGRLNFFFTGGTPVLRVADWASRAAKRRGWVVVQRSSWMAARAREWLGSRASRGERWVVMGLVLLAREEVRSAACSLRRRWMWQERRGRDASAQRAMQAFAAAPLCAGRRCQRAPAFRIWAPR